MPNRSLNILIVEDHYDTAELLAIELQRLGYAAAITGDCAAALRAARNSPFDVVFCDIGLPDGNGCDLFQQLKLIRPICGIAVSGYVMPDEIRRYEKCGFLYYLEKPFHLGDIGKALDRVIDEDEPCLPQTPDDSSYAPPPSG